MNPIERKVAYANERERKDRRDRFAAAALTGIFASGQRIEAADLAVEYADALIAELDKEQS